MKCKIKQYVFRLAPLILVSCMFVFALSPSASAAPINYRDLDYSVVVDGDNDIVTVSLPVDLSKIIVADEDWNVVHEIYGSRISCGISDDYHAGIEFLSGYGLSISNIPSGTEMSFLFDISSTSVQITGGSLYVDLNFRDSSGTSVSSSRVSLGNKPLGSVSANFVIPSVPSAIAVFPAVWWTPVSAYNEVDDDGWTHLPVLNLRIVSVTLTMSISSLYRLQEETGRSNELLEEVKDQLAEQGKTMQDVLDQQEQTNEKLDDIISGGAAGDDLIDAGDKIEDAGSGMGDSLDGMQDYEDQYTGEIDNYMADILAGADINLLSLPLDFAVRYINKIVEGIPRAYMVVFTLPMVLGILFFFAQHVVRAPRPDPTGDIVTRETFTTTEILEGRGKGRSTTTRTTTTSVITGIERGSG